MAFKDLSEVLPGRHLDLPVNGKTYRIPAPSGETWMRLQKIGRESLKAQQGKGSDLSSIVLDDEAEESFWEDLLGPVLDELVADKVDSEAIKHIAATVMTWMLYDKDTAEKYWEYGSGEASAPAGNRQARRAAEAAARKTPSPGSTSGTRTSRPRRQGKPRGPRS